jgi:hypothetical protein
MGEGHSGFEVQPGVLTAHEATGLIAALESVRGRSRAGARHLMSHPAVAALAGDARLLAQAQRVLGRDAKPYRATLFDKSPGSNWLVAWHQDTALPLRFRREVSGGGDAPDAVARVPGLDLHLCRGVVAGPPNTVLDCWARRRPRGSGHPLNEEATNAFANWECAGSDHPEK